MREFDKKQAKDFRDMLEEIKNSSFGIIQVEESEEPKMDFIVEVASSRYEELIACETELKILKSALSVVNGCSQNDLRKIFRIERREV